MTADLQMIQAVDSGDMESLSQTRESTGVSSAAVSRVKLAATVAFVLAVAGFAFVGLRVSQVRAQAETFTRSANELEVERDFSVELGTANTWVEQSISQIPGISEAQLSVRMLGAEVNGTHVTGHLATLANPLDRVSLALPPGGCGTREKTTVTAKAQKHVCKLAINAGYFNVHNGACIGNVVSHSQVIQTVPLSQGNVNFGIKDGKFYIGYFSPEEIAGFDHMVSGVVWLVRDGKNYVDQGWKEANITVQTSGDKYATNLASRTAVGFDKAGRLIIVQVDGSIAVGHNKRGMNMKVMADLLIDHGAVQAINLDGGGSSAMAQNGVLISYPSDNRPPSCDASGLYQCERPVSTILCLHEQPIGTSVPTSSGGSHIGSIIIGALISLLSGAAVTFLAVRFLPFFDDDEDYDKQLSAESTPSVRTVAKKGRGGL